MDVVRDLSADVDDGTIDPDSIDGEMISERLMFPDEPDLLIKTGANRLSDFAIWQSVYAELYFTDVNWRDFRKRDFLRAVLDYQDRQRRFDSNAGVDFSMNLSTAGSSPGDDGPLPNGRMRVPRPPRLPQSPPPVAPRSYLDLQDTQRPRASSRSRSGSDATHPPHRFRCSYHYVSKLSASLAHSTGSVNRPVLYPNSGTDGVWAGAPP